MIKTVTKDDLIELGFAPGTARKIIHTGKLLLVNRGFNIYDNKRIGTIPASVAEELLGIELQKEAQLMALRKSRDGTWIVDVSNGIKSNISKTTQNCKKRIQN